MRKAACAAVVVLAAFAVGQEPPPARPDGGKANGEFTGKVVAVFCKNSAHDAFLEEPTIRPLGRRDYLVGKAAALSDGQAVPAGTRIWVAVDEIDELIEYRSREEARGSLQRRTGR